MAQELYLNETGCELKRRSEKKVVKGKERVENEQLRFPLSSF